MISATSDHIKMTGVRVEAFREAIRNPLKRRGAGLAGLRQNIQKGGMVGIKSLKKAR